MDEHVLKPTELLLELPTAVFEALKVSAVRSVRTPALQACFLISKALAEEVEGLSVSASIERSRYEARNVLCLVSAGGCTRKGTNRGLCALHRSAVAYHVSRGNLDMGWLVRHGRIEGPDPSGGVAAETLETLPRLCRTLKRGGHDIKWLFGWPEALRERAHLEREVRARKSEVQ